MKRRCVKTRFGVETERGVHAALRIIQKFDTPRGFRSHEAHMALNKLSRLFLAAATSALLCLPIAARAEKIFSVSKWQRTEIILKSSVNYTNALQEAEVRALFVSPLGETNRVYGFWDGGKTWRVRFKPTFPGRWKYYTMCSDTANRGLNGQSGEFDCTAPKGESSFAKHGPIQVARDQQHLEHADRTPFLWLGDTAWLAAAKSSASEWEHYTQTRASQKFNVTTWRLQTDKQDAKAAAFNGCERVNVNLDFAKQLDAKIVAANRAGLLNAIAPLWEIGDALEAALPEDQAITLMRYAMARWGADDVAWVVAFECDSTGAQAARWQRIGRAVFNAVSHAPVILLPGESLWALDGFRQERWANVFGIQTTTATDETSLAWLLNGPIATERTKTPMRPIITVNPPLEGTTSSVNSRSVSADLSRRLMWWSLLLNTPAGVSYASKDIAEWNVIPRADEVSQPWRQALIWPGAAAIAPMSDCFAGKDFWRLTPSAKSLANPSEFDAPSSHVAAAKTGSQDMIVIYSPQDRIVSLAPGTIPANGKSAWFNPRTGETRAANSQANAANLKFETPSAGDWLLIVSADRKETISQVASRPKKTGGEIDKRKRD